MALGKVGTYLQETARTFTPGGVVAGVEFVVSRAPAAAHAFTFIPKGGTPFTLGVNTFRKLSSFAADKFFGPIDESNVPGIALRNGTFLAVGGMIFTHISPLVGLGEISGKDAAKWLILIALIEGTFYHFSENQGETSGSTNPNRKPSIGHHHTHTHSDDDRKDLKNLMGTKARGVATSSASSVASHGKPSEEVEVPKAPDELPRLPVSSSSSSSSSSLSKPKEPKFDHRKSRYSGGPTASVKDDITSNRHKIKDSSSEDAEATEKDPEVEESDEEEGDVNNTHEGDHVEQAHEGDAAEEIEEADDNEEVEDEEVEENTTSSSLSTSSSSSLSSSSSAPNAPSIGAATMGRSTDYKPEKKEKKVEDQSESKTKKPAEKANVGGSAPDKTESAQKTAAKANTETGAPDIDAVNEARFKLRPTGKKK